MKGGPVQISDSAQASFGHSGRSGVTSCFCRAGAPAAAACAAPVGEQGGASRDRPGWREGPPATTQARLQAPDRRSRASRSSPPPLFPLRTVAWRGATNQGRRGRRVTCSTRRRPAQPPARPIAERAGSAPCRSARRGRSSRTHDLSCPSWAGYGSSLAEESERCTRCGGSGLVMVADEREQKRNGDQPPRLGHAE